MEEERRAGVGGGRGLWGSPFRSHRRPDGVPAGGREREAHSAWRGGGLSCNRVVVPQQGCKRARNHGSGPFASRRVRPYHSFLALVALSFCDALVRLLHCFALILLVMQCALLICAGLALKLCIVILASLLLPMLRVQTHGLHGCARVCLCSQSFICRSGCVSAVPVFSACCETCFAPLYDAHVFVFFLFMRSATSSSYERSTDVR